MTEPTTKRAVVEDLLGQGMVLVTLDATAEGVDVPEHLRNDSQLRLNLSYRFGLPVEVDDDGVLATLTFGGVPYDCVLPWPSIYLVVSHVSGRPVLFPDDVPEELMRLLTEQEGQQPLAEGTDWDAKGPQLTLIHGEPSETHNDPEGADTDAASDDPSEDERKRRPRNHLRVVK